MFTIKEHLKKLTSSQMYSLRQKMLTRTALLMCTVLAILSVGVWHYANTSADYSYDRLLSSASVTMLDGINVAKNKVHIDLPYSAFEILQLAPEDKVYYAIYGPNGDFLSGYSDLPLSPSVTEQASTQPRYELHFYKQQKVRFIVRHKRLSERSVAGNVSIILGQTTIARDEQMRDTLYAALTTLMAVMAIALLVMWVAINRALSPLSWLSSQLVSQSPMENGRLPATKILEVAPLTHAINNYRQQWLDALVAMRDFIADASHQIRTAQATTKAQFEIALSSKNERVDKKVVEAIYQDHTKLTRLTNQLLVHATIVHRGDHQAFTPIDMHGFLQDIITYAVRDYAHTNIEFEYVPASENITILGDEIVLKEALRNVIDNAVAHGTSDRSTTYGIIRISLETCDLDCRVCIEDNGQGIPENQRMHALERFVKVGTNTQGSGLGLAIAQSAALSHQGRLILSKSELGGLAVSFSLPRLTETLHASSNH
ncbi:sensor histidine kinase [Marinomonas gallaica]|uniref:sensor histidine kinase n=1 Tax=Marinomonas gallaica TaxID=1806667 RepID=UPI003CE59AB0